MNCKNVKEHCLLEGAIMLKERNRLFVKWLALTLTGVLVALTVPLIAVNFEKRNSGNVVVVLDPGHGGEDVGAVNYDIPLNEADLNLAIALACRDELLRYDGIEVYMTHEGLAENERMVIEERVALAEAVDADILISLHCNDAESKTANGAEVYVSHSTYSKSYRRESTELAVCILKQFYEMDITVRGVKTRLSNGDRVYSHPNGFTEIGDYYGVIGETIGKYNIPGILVEHGFMYGDSVHFDSAEKLKTIGQADARGIAEFFGLSLKNEETVFGDEVFVVSEQELLSASDAEAKILALPKNIMADSFYKVEEARLAYSCLTKNGRELLSDGFAERLTEAVYLCDELRHEVTLCATDDAPISIDRFNRALYVRQDGAMSVSALKRVLDILVKDWAEVDTSQTESEIVVIDKEGNRLKNRDSLYTGCSVALLLDGRVADELRIIVPGDINGDGVVDNGDCNLLEEYLRGEASFSELRRLAADRDSDGFVTQADLEYYY